MANIFLKKFSEYLDSQKLSNNSIKNYKADLRAFFRWLKKQKGHAQVDISDLNQATFTKYRDWLKETNTPQSTLRRYLSSLRRFGEFLKESSLTGKDPVAQVNNPSPQLSTRQVLKRFKSYLIKEDLAKSTVKNYMADVSQFVHWSLKGSNEN